MPFDQENLNYPAVIVGFTANQPQTYISSVQTGVNNLVGEINSLAVDCPYTNILLAGYSQGADVINEAVGVYHSTAYTVPAITSTARSKITAVVLFGDPNYRPGETWDASGDGTGVGVIEKPTGEFSNTYHSVFLPPTYTVFGQTTAVQSYCFPGDEFCQSNIQGATIHASYKTSQAIPQAWTFISNWLESND